MRPAENYKRHQGSMMRERFDKAYYERFYENPATRAATVASARRQAEFISAYLNYIELPVQRILDIGCGMGRLLRALQRCFPKAQCVGVEYSEYLCQRYGWQSGSVVDYQDDPYDLVVCVDVLSYLDTHECGQALRNIAGLAHGAAFLGLITEEDREICDFERTDRRQHLHPAAWYRRRINQSFQSIGGGLYLRKPVQAAMWTMDLGR